MVHSTQDRHLPLPSDGEVVPSRTEKEENSEILSFHYGHSAIIMETRD
jgi:hypothetical protein